MMTEKPGAKSATKPAAKATKPAKCSAHKDGKTRILRESDALHRVEIYLSASEISRLEKRADSAGKSRAWLGGRIVADSLKVRAAK